MEKIEREKLVSKIVCVSLAIILWLFVLYQENPSTTKTVKDVSLVITGEQTLKENGFAVYSISEENVDVSVTAKRLNLPIFSKKTLTANVNVSSIKESGTYTLHSTISSTADASASYYVKSNDIIVVIEPIEKATYKVEADMLDPLDESLVLNSYELSRDKVTVTAPKSILKNIGYVKTEQFAPKKNSTEHTAKVVVYDKDGKVLNGVQCSPEEIKVTYSLQSVKTVPVVLSVTGSKTFSLPSEYYIKIQGSGESFDSIEKIATEKVNLTSHEAGEKVTVKLKVPKDVKVIEGSTEIEIEIKEEYYN